jgi:hypothetical protein
MCKYRLLDAAIETYLGSYRIQKQIETTKKAYPKAEQTYGDITSADNRLLLLLGHSIKGVSISN